MKFQVKFNNWYGKKLECFLVNIYSKFQILSSILHKSVVVKSSCINKLLSNKSEFMTKYTPDKIL